jgi:hypothetical protein
MPSLNDFPITQTKMALSHRVFTKYLQKKTHIKAKKWLFMVLTNLRKLT